MKKALRIQDIIFTFLATMAGLIVIFPILYGFFGAFKSPSEFTSYPPTFVPNSFLYMENFREAMHIMPFGRYMLNSLIVAVMGMTAKMLFAVMAAYANVYYEFKGKQFIFFFVLGTMMIPADTLVITNYQTITRLHMMNTYLSMSITAFVGASQMFMLRQSFRSIPKEMKEAALMDGCGDVKFLSFVLIPLASPILCTLYIQGFLNLWNAYLWPLLVTNVNEMRTVQVGITMLTTIEGTNYHQILAGVTLTILPAIVLFLFLRKRLVHGLTDGALVE